MGITFSKYHGAGNDFILVDDFAGNFPARDFELIRRLCNRRFGVGADGLMLLRKSQTKDFEMLYFNSDGFEGTMCGNGGRCLVAFARDCGYVDHNKTILFDAIDGGHAACFVDPETVRLKMKDVDQVIKTNNGYRVDTGSIHHVEYVDKIVDMDVYGRGNAIRRDTAYTPEGCNVNFIHPETDGSISIRTYERGVEGETLACGTGSVASAIVHHYLGNLKTEYTLRATGGTLKICFEHDEKGYKNIWLEGPIKRVFKGELER